MPDEAHLDNKWLDFGLFRGENENDSLIYCLWMLYLLLILFESRNEDHQFYWAAPLAVSVLLFALPSYLACGIIHQVNLRLLDVSHGFSQFNMPKWLELIRASATAAAVCSGDSSGTALKQIWSQHFQNLRKHKEYSNASDASGHKSMHLGEHFIDPILKRHLALPSCSPRIRPLWSAATHLVES